MIRKMFFSPFWGYQEYLQSFRKLSVYGVRDEKPSQIQIITKTILPFHHLHGQKVKKIGNLFYKKKKSDASDIHLRGQVSLS